MSEGLLIFSVYPCNASNSIRCMITYYSPIAEVRWCAVQLVISPHTSLTHSVSGEVKPRPQGPRRPGTSSLPRSSGIRKPVDNRGAARKTARSSATSAAVTVTSFTLSHHRHWGNISVILTSAPPGSSAGKTSN